MMEWDFCSSPLPSNFREPNTPCALHTQNWPLKFYKIFLVKISTFLKYSASQNKKNPNISKILCSKSSKVYFDTPNPSNIFYQILLFSTNKLKHESNIYIHKVIENKSHYLVGQSLFFCLYKLTCVITFFLILLFGCVHSVCVRDLK